MSMDVTYPVGDMTADQLILQTEALLGMYLCILSSCIEQCDHPASPFVGNEGARMLGDQLKPLLQHALRDLEFRRHFVQHFESHPEDDMREVAWPWAQHYLEWDANES